MRKYYLFYSTAFIVCVAGMSCHKLAGQGGSASIIGKIFAKDYTANFGSLKGSYYAPEEKVYIMYGDDITYSDKVVTNYDGIFEFKYLRKGNYRVYVYSKDKTQKSISGIVPVIADVTIAKKNEVVDVGTLVIYK